MSAHTTPRSYIVKTTDGTVLRRNRRHLKQTNEDITILSSDYVDDEDNGINNGEARPNTDNPEITSYQRSSSVPLTTTYVTNHNKVYCKVDF